MRNFCSKADCDRSPNSVRGFGLFCFCNVFIKDMIEKSLLNFKIKLTDLLFPKFCGYCGNSFEEGISNILCSVCFASITPYEDPVCGHCGVSLPLRAFEEAVTVRCRDCGEDAYCLDQVRSLGAYEGPIRIIHHAFKFEGMETLRIPISGKMYDHIPGAFWDGVAALVPIPLSSEKERERGYNPAAYLAEELSIRAGIPVQPILEKVKSTPPQMSLTKTERFKNPKGAYRVKGKMRPPDKILLVDDVFTTGSTLEECAKVLKRAGAQWVGALVFGRTPHR